MKPVGRLFLLIVCFCCLFATTTPTAEATEKFDDWLKALRVEALAAGISPQTLDAALAGVKEPLPKVVELDRKQPEFSQSLRDYVAARVSPKRIANGRRMLQTYPTWLGRVEKKYDVQRRFIVALWGIETNYGEHTGGFPVVQSLVTLAYDDRRASYFRRELLDALRILDAGHIPLKQLRGSWAGAMGQCQFMPSSFRRYAVDADGDGRIDIWRSVPDVLASAANYLKKMGWHDDQTWGRPVKLPAGFDPSLAGLQTRQSLARWRALGVRKNDGHPLPGRNLEASLLLPDGPDGQAYLVYDNFRALLAWNKSNAFAVAVGTLADQLDPR